jgi:NAD(P)-dependent dehydrogenase (short-subunit alcohol dehydrogenase family)
MTGRVDRLSGKLTGLGGIITGGGSGIGAAFAAGFVKEGARLALFDVDCETAEKTAADIGDSARAYKVDVADEDSVASATEEAFAQLGKIDFLVNDAGVRQAGAFVDHQVDVWKRTLDVNVLGGFLCGRAVVPKMVEQGGGKILNIASISGILGLKNRIAYSTSKAAVIGMTRSMANELGEFQINVNAIAPGVIETPMTASYFEDEEFAQLIRDNVALGRWGQTSDLVPPAVFLCGPDSDYVSGQILTVDGGWTAGKGY